VAGHYGEPVEQARIRVASLELGAARAGF